jgi:hypothetical protein
VSFFDPPASAARSKMLRPVRWQRPRIQVLPGVAPVALVLARTDDTVVALADMRGYPTGFVFTLSLRLRNVPAGQPEPLWPFPLVSGPGTVDGESLPDGMLRFGLQFADGRRATNLDRYPFIPEDQEPDQPVLIEGGGVGGGGGGAVWDMEYAVRPLPPPGPLAFVCAWPGRGIPESRVEVDAEPILEAAARAVTLWADGSSCLRLC